MPSRRALLGAAGSIALAATAGCVGGDGAGGAPTRTTSGPTTDSPADSTPYPDAAVPFPDGPKSRPERPAELTAETVRAFVHDHEYRYVYNELWFGERTEVSLECEVLDVASHREGYRATVECTGSSTARGTATANGTATQVHADYFTQRYRYYVDGDSVRRWRPDS